MLQLSCHCIDFLASSCRKHILLDSYQPILSSYLLQPAATAVLQKVLLAFSLTVFQKSNIKNSKWLQEKPKKENFGILIY